MCYYAVRGKTRSDESSSTSVNLRREKTSELITPYKLMQTPPKGSEMPSEKKETTPNRKMRAQRISPKGNPTKPMSSEPTTVAPQPTKPSPDFWNDVMGDMDKEDERKEKALLRKIDDLTMTMQIKWPRTRARHARKAAVYIRQWARGAKDIVPDTAPAIKAATNIIRGVHPMELRQEVEALRDRALPEGGAAEIPPFANSVHFTGMLILQAAKDLDKQKRRELLQNVMAASATVGTSK